MVGLVALLASCGGKPVGSKVPRANPTDVAVVAAAAATAMTLANPDAAGRKPESDEQAERKPQNVSKEPMPAGVLDRAEANQDEDEDLPPCKKPDKDKKSGEADKSSKTVELFPTTPSTAPKRCRDVEGDEQDKD